MQIRKTVVETPNKAPVSVIWGQNKPTPPALAPAAHTASLSGSGGPCGNPTVLAYPVSWTLQCGPAFPTTAACAGLSGPLCSDSNSVVRCQASAAPHNSPSCTSTFKTRTTWASLTTLSNSTAGSPWSLTSLDRSCIQLCVLTERKHFPRQLFSRSREPSQFRLYSFKWIQRSSLQEMGSCPQDHCCCPRAAQKHLM